MSSDAHRCLREATQTDHARVEARIDILPRIASGQGRRALVRQFYCFHAEAEAAIGGLLADLPGLEFGTRLRTPRIRRDLEALGLAAPQAADPPWVQDVPTALGWVYVLEGSTLGGRVIRRQVTAAGDDLQGLGFLDPYGERTGERWRAFLAVLEAELQTASDVEAAVQGATEGFRLAERRLCGALADA